MRFQAIIFDLDGTLLDTIDDIADAMNLALSQNQFPTHAVGRYREMVGLGLEQLVHDILPESARNPETIKRMAQVAGGIYAAQWKNKTKPYPGIEALLKVLHGRGLKLAVLSNKPHAFTQACAKALLPPGMLEIVDGAREDVPRKPAPDGALKIAEQWHVAPAQMLFVGDSTTDMQTAKAAGMYAMGVAWGYGQEADMRRAGADAIIHKPEELLEKL